MIVRLQDALIDNIPVGYVSSSTIHGIGLFAGANIAQGDVIGRLGGKPMLWSKLQKQGAIQYINLEWNALADGLLLVREQKTKYAAINHAREPNIELEHGKRLKDSVRIYALRNIRKGEELLLDYRKEPLPPEYLAMHGMGYL